MQAQAAGKFDDMLARGVRVDRWVKVMDVHRVMMLRRNGGATQC
jgi:hypothetical protein